MAQKPITMEQLNQVLQLKNDGVSIREIARRVGISRNSVRKYLVRLDNKNNLDARDMASSAYCNDDMAHDAERMDQLVLHFKNLDQELKKTGVTRYLLHQEYIAKHPDGYSYSRYCHHLAEHQKNKDVTMHLDWEPGDMMMIDFAGKLQHYVDTSSGELISCQVFVGILPSSGLIYCKAVPSQKSEDFMDCINSMLKFYGGAPATILCDNLKTAVTRACRYEPVFTELCQQLSEHYGTTFSATRPYSPRDKALVEGAVSIVYNHVYAPLRNQEFTSLEQLNTAMQQQLKLLNHKAYKKTPYSRWYYFEQKEQSLLKPLPPLPFTSKKVVTLTVQRNYHVQLTEDHLYFSVPYRYVGKKVKVLYDNRSVEVYLGLERIAVHTRKPHIHTAYTTLAEHMPPHHQRMHQIKGFNKEDLLVLAAAVGASTKEAAELMLQNSIYVEQNYKACFGMLMLSKNYGNERLEAACKRALQSPRINYTIIKNILKSGTDKQILIPLTHTIILHENIRGAEHYK